MGTEKSASKKLSKVKKILIAVPILVIILILLIIITVPMYLSSDSGKNMILGKINDSIDGNIQAESFSMGWLKGIEVNTINFNDTSGNTNVTVGKITVKPKYLSLLAGNVVVDEAQIDDPRVSIKLSAMEKVGDDDAKTDDKDKIEDGTVPVFPVVNVNLEINRGNLKLETAGFEKLELRDINSKLAIRPLGQKSSFDISMAIADENDVTKITANGQVKSDKQWSMANTTGNLNIEVSELDLGKLGPLFTLLKVDVQANGIVSVKIDAKMNKGLFENVDSKIFATNLDIRGDALKGDRIRSSKLNAVTKFNTDENFVNIDVFDIQADWLTANVKGTIPKSLTSFDDFLRADSKDALAGSFDCDMAKTLAQIKNMAGFKENFDITHGRLSGDIETTAGSGKRVISGKIKLWTLEGKFPVKQIVLSRPVDIEVKITSAGKDITVEKLMMDSSFAKILCNGKIDNMLYEADIDFEKAQIDMKQFFEPKYKIAGQAKLKGVGSWKDKVFSTHGRGHLNNVVITTGKGKMVSEQAANIEYALSNDTANKILSVNKLRVQSSVGSIGISNFVIPMHEGASKDLKINALANIDLAKAMNWAVAFDAMDEKIQLAGQAKSDLMIDKRGNILKVATKQTTINNLRVSYPNQKPFTQDNVLIAFNGEFDTANKIYDIKTLNVTSEQVKISGKIRNTQIGANIKTQGNLKAKYNLAAVSTMVAPYLPQGFSVAGERDDYFNFVTQYPKNDPSQKIANLSAKTSFGFDKAKYMGITIGKTELDVQINKGVMTVAPFSATANNGKITFGATADFGKPGRIMKTPGAMRILDKIEINTETSDALLGYVNPLFANALNVTGILNFSSNKMEIPLENGYKNAIAINGEMSIVNARLGASSLLGQIIQLAGIRRDPIINVLPTRFKVANGVMHYENDMVMDIDGKRIIFSGGIGLDKYFRQFSVTLPWEISGKPIRLPLKGTIDNPQIDTDKLIETQIQEQVENVLGDLLKKL